MTRTISKIIVEDHRCKRCGYCIEFCPRSVYESTEDGLPLVKDLEKCSACMFCELRCPDFAIHLEVLN